MINRDLVKPKTAWRGADGEVRHVIILHKPGSGYGVTWDSVPLDGDYWRGHVEREHLARPHGYMPLAKFAKWAVEQC